MTLTVIMAALTVLLLAATALSFMRIAHGFVRVFSFPRLQILALTLALLIITIMFVPNGFAGIAIIIGLAVVAIAQATCIIRFTPLWRRQSAEHEGAPDVAEAVSILSFNVRQSNRNHAGVLSVAREADADLAIFMETDAAWVDGLAPLTGEYAHCMAHPLDNAYGMVLFSRLPLSDARVRYLVMDEVPSITATVTLAGGRRFRLFCVHPEPPVPTVDSLGRDAELVQVAGLVRQETLPVIVTGDLNDVAWSHTTRLFQRLSRLLDPRVGRGFYSTFDARFFFMRWPLDHLFHDARFRLVAMRRMQRAGSDHFPMYFRLLLADDTTGVAMPEAADATDRAEAAEIRNEGRKLERDPVGSDWEE